MPDPAAQDEAAPPRAAGATVLAPALALAGWMAFLAWLAFAS